MSADVAGDGTLAHGPPRRRLLVWFGTGVVAVTGVGLAATRLVRSPQQVLADSAAPPRGVLTAQVERRVLRDTVVLRGLVGAGASVEVTPTPREGRALVTAVRINASDQFGLGAVLVEVAGRPLLALGGEVPAYRDLRPGMRGKDVAQLQASLRALGHDPHAADGVFGAGTKRALTAWYADLGYEVATTGEADAAADRQVTLAARALTQAQEELARLEASPPTPGPGEPDPVKAARQRLAFAREDLDAAKAARAELERTTGAMLPLSEVVFLPGFPGRVEKLSARVGVEAAAPLITLSSGELVVRARLNPGQRALIKPGLPVEIVSELHGLSASGVMASVGDLEQDESGGRSHPMVVTPTETALDKRLAGADVRLTVQAAATDGEVLVVPISAVYAGADGATAVLKQLADGEQVRVAVTAGASGDGYVAVTPIGGGLDAGDRVVVGADATS